MEIESVDFFYLSMPEILDIGDGSQDVLLVRVRAGGWEGWGECEASPLVSIASLVAPMSHSTCKPVAASVLGQRLDSVEDIRRINAEVRANSFDQLQAPHALSGIDIALWDLMGHRFEEPVYRLLGISRPEAKMPYASVLFGETPEETWRCASAAGSDGYRAVKFGWMGFGAGPLGRDVEHLAAAREGFGSDGDLLIDAGMAWGHDPEPALLRAPALERFGVLFIEEPFVPGADAAYRSLKAGLTTVRTAGGEGCHSVEMACSLIDNAGVDFIQIDAGRIGGITGADQVAEYARRQGVTFINHTFTSDVQLSASLQPYLGDRSSMWCEYPISPKPVSRNVTVNHLERGSDGMVRAPESPGLGLQINHETIAEHLVDAEIVVGGEVLYRTPQLGP